MCAREIDEKEFYVDPDIKRAETLPANAFDDVDFLSLELKIIFARTWLLVPEAENSGRGSASTIAFLKAPGSRFPLSSRTTALSPAGPQRSSELFSKRVYPCLAHTGGIA